MRWLGFWLPIPVKHGVLPYRATQIASNSVVFPAPVGPVIATREDAQIVCGAPNAREGLVAPVALVSAQLPNGLTIKRAKIRGEESQCGLIRLMWNP